MSTVIVNRLHMFRNAFSSYGRATNKLYRELNANGCNYLLERQLPDKSRVILAYPNSEAKASKFALKLNADGTMEQKTSQTAYLLGLVTDKLRAITKIFADENGYKTHEYVKRVIYNKNNEITRKETYHYTDKYVTHYEYNKIGEEIQESLKKAFRDGSNNEYAYSRATDGTKTFKRRFNGVEYFFTNKK